MRRPPVDPGPLSPAERELVLAVRGLACSSVEATVHDGRLVQIERRERVRLAAAESTVLPTRSREADPSLRTATARPELRADRIPGEPS